MTDRKVFHDSVEQLPEESGLAPSGMMVNAMLPEHRDESMTVLFSLDVAPEVVAQLEARVAKGELVPQSELDDLLAPAPADREALVTWLKQHKFEIESGETNGTGIYAHASVSQIEKSLKVKMVRVTREGITYTAAQNAPSLPADVGKSVHAILGLQPFRQFRKHSLRCRPAPGSRLPVDFGTPMKGAGKSKSAHVAAAPAPAIANAPPYLVSEVLKAYNGNGLNVTGKGQTIAILIDTFPAVADLVAFWKHNGLKITPSQVQMINVNSVALPAPSGEETLDASWASGTAPGATIKIYASGTLSFVDLDKALDRIIADVRTDASIRQLSISLGLGETFMGGPNGVVRTQHMKYLQLAASGVNVFVSSGDAGSNPDNTGHSPTGPTQAEYAASDTSVIGVGGTSLVLNSSGTVSKETGWAGSGGGKSIFFTRPAWQVGAGMPVGHERLVPDVSLVADPNTGAFLILNGKQIQIGGTSWSAPVWAGLCALINEARVTAKKKPLTFLNPLIYPLLGKPSFRDITSGSNGAYSAGPGYDLVTGIGVPNVKVLLAALVSLP